MFTFWHFFSFFFLERDVEMENRMLKNLILSFRGGEIKAFPVIYEEFKKMINFYSRKIGDEDSGQELMMFLIETLYGIELERFISDSNDNLKRYIAVALRNKYIALSKANVRDLTMLLDLYEKDAIYNYSDDEILLRDMLGSLSEKQRKIIIYKYIYGYSDLEISKILCISRQAVNRLKNRGFDIIRENFALEEQ